MYAWACRPHGFVLQLGDCANVLAGSHRLDAQCLALGPKGQWYPLRGSPRCFSAGNKVPCPGAASSEAGLTFV